MSGPRHAGDLLSALVDGELTEREAARVREHVATCAGCAGELDDVRDARRLVRGLPGLDVPEPLAARLLGVGPVASPPSSSRSPSSARRQRRRRPPRAARAALVAAAGASIAAGVAAFAVLNGDTVAGPVEPEVAVAVERHASTIGALEAGGRISESPQRFLSPDPAPPTTAEPRSVDDLPTSLDAPEVVGRYRLVEAYEVDGGVHLVYRRGTYGLSIIETPGELDWDALPDDGTRLRVAGQDVWRWDERVADGRLYVVEGDGVVMTVIGDEPGDAVLDVVAELPHARAVALKARVQRAVDRALELFTPAS